MKPLIDDVNVSMRVNDGQGLALFNEEGPRARLERPGLRATQVHLSESRINQAASVRQDDE